MTFGGATWVNERNRLILSPERYNRQTYNLHMPIPTIHINISANVVSAYAAVMSTIIASVQAFNYFRDRAHLKIRVQPHMKMIGDARYQGMSLIIMYVVNGGRRPVTITSVGAYQLFPNDPFVITDVRPQCPCELTEGKQLTAILDQKGLDLSVMESWEAYTATGRTFRLAIVPWYRRWWNRRRFRRQAIKEGRKKKESS